MDNFSFLSTKKLTGPYKFIIRSCKIHFQNLFDIDAKLIFFDYRKNNLRAIFLLIAKILKTFFFSRNLMEVKYKKINISRYTVPEIYKNYKIFFCKYEFLMKQ